MNGSKDCVDGL